MVPESGLLKCGSDNRQMIDIEIVKRILKIIALAPSLLSSAHCQETILGSVHDGETKQGIPYAAVHLMNTCIGTSCNESGQFSLHIPQGMETANVVISSLGYMSDTVTAQSLAKKKGKVTLQQNPIQLGEVKVVEYTTARKLMDAVAQLIPQNYRTEDAIGIWHYRNRQMLNDSLFVRSEGLIRNYMPAYGTMLSLGLYYGQDTSEWNEELYRLYQSLDTVMVFNKAYWRRLVGPEMLDNRLELQNYNKPSDCMGAIGSDFVNYMEKKGLRLLSKKSKYTMETFSQDGNNYYRVTVAFQPRGRDCCDTAIIVINKDDLAIVDAVHIHPLSQFRHKMYLLINSWYDNMLYTSRTHWRYYKYNGKYQLDFIQREYEYLFEFSQKTVDAGCNVHCLNLKGQEECILSEYDYERVVEYKYRFFDNKHPRTEENIRETERILRAPHNKIPW